MKYPSNLPEIKWVRKVDPELDIHWRYLYSLTRPNISSWTRTLDGYTAELRQDVTVEDFQRAVEGDDPAGALDRMAWVSADDALKVQAAALMTTALERAGKAEVHRLKLAMRFDLDNPFVLPWVDQNVALLVTRVSDETKRAIRTVI
ncbi:MAG: hypothetical protein NUV34_09075, partial [Sulfuricaulis sp.]|nr:hypothetical protein [Sulfuricaulis sp.]